MQLIQCTICFSGQARAAHNSWMGKEYSICSENVQGRLCFWWQA